MKKDYKNKTVYIRESHNDEHPYTVISNHIVKDERLTATEKGIMLMILANNNSYVLNSSYLQKESGLGKVQFNKTMKRLQEHNYLLKKPLKSGGYKWIIMESTLIFEELQKIGYLKYNAENSSWIINEKMESMLQVFDFHRKSENGKPINGNTENQKPINGNTESRIPDSQPIISTNEINSQVGIINKEENTNEKNTNETLDDEVLNLGSFSEVESEKVDKNKPIQNSLPILFQNSESFQAIFQNGSLTLDDFKLCSDSYIANVFLSIKLENKVQEWSGSLKSLNYNPKHYGIYVYAGKNALELDLETELKNELIGQSKMSAKELHKIIYGY